MKDTGDDGISLGRRTPAVYAAKILLDREYPTPEPGQYETDNTGRVTIYLPHNGRDPLPGETAEEKEKREKDFDEWVNMFAEHCARLVARRILGKPKPRYEEGELAIAVAAVDRVMDKIEAEAAAEEEQKAGHGADTAPPLGIEYAVKPRYNGATAPDRHSADEPIVSPARQSQQPAAKPPTGFIVLFCRPFQAFWAGNQKYEADEVGEILVSEDQPQDRDALLHSGCRAKR
jgi:hypothetical protein